MENKDKIVSIDRFLQKKSEKDGFIYDYVVTAEGSAGLMLNVYRLDGGENRILMFKGPMNPENGKRSDDTFLVKSPNCTYRVYFFM